MNEQIDALEELDERAKLGWRSAAELIRPFGPVAANFAEATRMLVGSHLRGEESVSSSGQNHLRRLIKNDTLKATYYFFSKQFKPGLFLDNPKLDERDFIKIYTAIDHAAILSFCYLFKNLSKKIEKEEWEYVQVPLYEALAIGGVVGQAIKEIGLGIGLIIRGVRYLAFAPFMRENRKGFKEYRQHLKAHDIPFDTAFEQRMWQCSSIQIGGLLLERMGFPRTVTLQFIAAAERSASVAADPIFGAPFRLAECLVDAYMEGHEIPTSTPPWVGKDLQLTAEVRGTLLAALNKVFDEKKRVEWLNKTSSDITPETTPELFKANDSFM
jgi:hypothetical protein